MDELCRNGAEPPECTIGAHTHLGTLLTNTVVAVPAQTPRTFAAEVGGVNNHPVTHDKLPTLLANSGNHSGCFVAQDYRWSDARIEPGNNAEVGTTDTDCTDFDNDVITDGPARGRNGIKLEVPWSVVSKSEVCHRINVH